MALHVTFQTINMKIKIRKMAKIRNRYNQVPHLTHDTTWESDKISKGAKIRNRYNQVPHLTHDTNVKVKNSQLDSTNESQEVSPFPAGDHKTQINIHTQRHNKHKTEEK